MIVLDTSAVSAIFRRRAPGRAEQSVVREYQRMVKDGPAVRIPGIVMQEVLSGITEPGQFQQLSIMLEGLRPIEATIADHRSGAEIANSCIRAGIAHSTVDCLIAAQTIFRGAELLTLDRDFSRIAPLCGLRLRAIR